MVNSEKIKLWLLNNKDNGVAWDSIQNRDFAGPRFIKETLQIAYNNNKTKNDKKRMHYYANGLYLAPTSINSVRSKQLGLFCLFDIKKYTVIGEYTGAVRSQEQQAKYFKRKLEKTRLHHSRYTWEYQDENRETWFIDPLDNRGKLNKNKYILPFINEPPPGENANLFAVHHLHPQDTISFVACDIIPAHQELFIMYGDDIIPHDRSYEVGENCTQLPAVQNYLDPKYLDLLGVQNNPNNPCLKFGVRRKSQAELDEILETY